MIPSTADLVIGWRAECAILDRKIADIRTGQGGMHLSADQKETAIQAMIETVADLNLLIDEFSKFEAFPIAFHREANRNEPEPVVRHRFPAQRHVASELVSA